MKSLSTFPVIVLFLFPTAPAATFTNDDITLYQIYSSAPNAQNGGTPGWLVYNQNLRAAATNVGFLHAGDPDSPGYFSVAPASIPLEQAVSSGPGASSETARRFPSWQGQADPGAVFDGSFASEYGNYIHTPLLLLAEDPLHPVTISGIVREGYSTAQNGGGSSFFTGTWTTWGESRVGVTHFGGDGILGGGDDTYVTSGNMADTPVLAFFATGSGISFQLIRQYDGTSWPISTTDDDIFPAYLQQWGNLVWDYRVDYSISYMTENNPNVATLIGDTLFVVPELSSITLVATAFLATFGVCVFKRRS